MKVKVTFTEKIFNELKNALAWDGKERAVYLLCAMSHHGDQLKLMPRELMVPTEQDYVHRSGGALEVTKEFINRVVNRAIDGQMDLLQCHIHPPNYPGRFSPVDAREEPRLMKHIAEKVDGLHHASLVFSSDFSHLDGWWFNRDTSQVEPLDKVVVVGTDALKVYFPTGVQPQAGNNKPARLDRTIKAFGQEAVELFGKLDFGVVGASGLGSVMLEMLVRDGANSILVCDPDHISESNLNRLVAALPENVGESKVEFYRKYLHWLNPMLAMKTLDQSFYNENVQRAFSQVDVLLGCVDSGARLAMNRLACANLIPYFDMGATVRHDEDRLSFIGGQVYSMIPGRNFCLSCSEVFNDLWKEYLSPSDQDRERAQGYMNDPETIPLVMHLDAVVTGLGYQTMLNYIWGLGQVPFKVHYDGLRHKVQSLNMDATGCMTCSENGYLGLGEIVPALQPNSEKAAANRTIPVAA